MSLTDRECKNFKPTAKRYKKADSRGLYLQVEPNGSKYWRVKYRFLRKAKTLSLGVYPEVSLEEAREQREAARKMIAAGIDPSAAKKHNKLSLLDNAANTFEAIARQWHEHNQEKWTIKYRQQILKRLEDDIFPQIGALAVKSITPAHILAVFRKIESRGVFETAHRLLQVCSSIFRYAVVTMRADMNPAADISGGLKPVIRSHYPTIEAKDLPQFLRMLDRNDARLYPQTRLATKLMMLTFVRTGELINAKWSEFDLENATWTIPAARMKMRRSHIVPLSRQAIEILHELKSLSLGGEWILPSVNGYSKHISNNTILKALERMGYKGKMTGHGFRALAMTTIKEHLHYRHEIIDRQLAHSPKNKIDAAYDRAAFLDDRRIMMQRWADYLDAMASNGKVVMGDFGSSRLQA